MIHYYAIKYLDENGHTKGYGYGESATLYADGQIVMNGSQKVLIEFEMGKEKIPAGTMLAVI